MTQHSGSGRVSGAVPPPLPGGALDYRAGGGGIDGAAWQALGRLCACDQAILPARCVKCNGEAEVRMKRKQFTWAPPLVYLGLLGGLLPCLILVLVLQKKATITYGLCGVHRRRHFNKVWISLGCVALAIACFAGAGMYDDAAAGLIILGFVVLLGMLIYLAIAGPVLKPARIDQGVAEFKGCGADFLASLPDSRYE